MHVCTGLTLEETLIFFTCASDDSYNKRGIYFYTVLTDRYF